MKSGIYISILGLVCFQFCFAQIKKEYKIWNPATDTLKVLEGQAWPGELSGFYNRLPSRVQQTVRAPVWGLSKNSAGLQLRFQTNADEIIVKYTVAGTIQMPHMPATGVSGVDLYAKTIDGKWQWAAGNYSFRDTIVYRFNELVTSDQHVGNREYTLYLPLYNSVKWMEIAVPEKSLFKPLPVRTDKPVVVYGTSIAQGACASRPGLVWTNILGRRLDRPVINLAFSGNGRLEKEIIELLTEIDAKIYVLDCLPNLIEPGFATAELKRRIVDAVGMLQMTRSGIPILLTEHDGYTNGDMNLTRKKQYTDANKALKEVFDSLILAGIKNIYLLSKETINQDIESMVDGTHPNDIGMMHYAEAYDKKIKQILNETAGTVSTTIPITQRRDANTYDWETRHNEVMQYNKTNFPQLVFIGNSITHFWGGLPACQRINGGDSWEKYFGSMQAVNMGFGWDRIENVLWRMQHGELDGITPKQIVLMIGTNNLQYNTDGEIVLGLQFLINAIRLKQPAANLLLMGIFPRRGMEKRISMLNRSIQKIATGKQIQFADAGRLLLNSNNMIQESLFSDGLHPNAGGYEKLGAFIVSRLKSK